MGKANRIRNQRASSALTNTVKTAKKNNQGMPSWAVNLIAIAITAFVVITIVLSLLSANGVFGRLTTAMSSDNFRVNENVMKYYFSEAASNAGSTATAEQVIATVKSDVKTMLALCEEAHKRGIKLDDEDEANIDLQIQMYELYSQYYGYDSVNTFIAASFGKGVNKTDVKKALSLQILASKCGEVLSDELLAAITSGEIDAKYQFTYGNDTITQLERYHASKCIISVDGIHERDGLTLYYSNESGIVRKMIESSDKVIVVADSSKLGRSAFSRVVSISYVDVLVTNKKRGSEEIAALREMGREVIEG